VRQKRHATMGSSQSSMPSTEAPQQQSLSSANVAKETIPGQVESTVIDNDNNAMKKKKKERSGWDLVHYKCRRRKARYDKCYAEWYNKKFLTAQDINQDETCDELFDIWKECVLKGMVKERERQGHGPPKEGSILGEYLEEQSEE